MLFESGVYFDMSFQQHNRVLRGKYMTSIDYFYANEKKKKDEKKTKI